MCSERAFRLLTRNEHQRPERRAGAPEAFRRGFDQPVALRIDRSAIATAQVAETTARFPEEVRAEHEEWSEQQVDRRANLRLLLAAFVQSASKLNTDFQSGSPNEATIEPSATIFGEEQGEMVR